MISLDQTDRFILRLLQRDGRMSNAELAERVHLSPSACLRRVRRLEEGGVIERYAMLVNQAAVGKPTNIFVDVTLQSQSEELLGAFEAAVRECPEIIECYLMAGDFDYLLRVAAAGTEDYERIHKTYLSRLPGVARIRTSFALRTVCKNSVLDI